MNEFLKAIDVLASQIEEKGYIYSKLKNGPYGTNFKEALLSYLHRVKSEGDVPEFPIYANFMVASTTPNNAYSVATFKIELVESGSLQITDAKISMYECHDGGLRTSMDLQFKSMNDIPSRQDLGNQIEEKWQKVYKSNQDAWNLFKESKPLKSKGKKL